jgi:hypothetical protein
MMVRSRGTSRAAKAARYGVLPKETLERVLARAKIDKAIDGQFKARLLLRNEFHRLIVTMRNLALDWSRLRVAMADPTMTTPDIDAFLTSTGQNPSPGGRLDTVSQWKTPLTVERPRVEFQVPGIDSGECVISFTRFDQTIHQPFRLPTPYRAGAVLGCVRVSKRIRKRSRPTSSQQQPNPPIPRSVPQSIFLQQPILGRQTLQEPRLLLQKHVPEQTPFQQQSQLRSTAQLANGVQLSHTINFDFQTPPQYSTLQISDRVQSSNPTPQFSPVTQSSGHRRVQNENYQNAGFVASPVTSSSGILRVQNENYQNAGFDNTPFDLMTGLALNVIPNFPAPPANLGDQYVYVDPLTGNDMNFADLSLASMGGISYSGASFEFPE